MESTGSVIKIIEVLDRIYPDARCTLEHATVYQLTIATILSAQCTDERVNIVTKTFFKKYPDFYSLAKAPINDIKEAIKSTGFYNNKANNIKKLAEIIVSEYKGDIPLDMEILTTLPGIGRKTANVILGEYATPVGIVVDTHVKRVAKLLGLTSNDDPEKIEKDLMNIVPREKWGTISHQLIQLGRNICVARKPKCNICPLSHLCRYYRERN